MKPTGIPYIGVTGFDHVSQVKKIKALLKGHNKGATHKRRLHVGVMASRGTIQDNPESWARGFPSSERLGGILSLSGVMNCLHYVSHSSLGELDLGKNLTRAVECAGYMIDALQLDLVWPDPDDIAFVAHASRKPLEIILQLGGKALAECGENPGDLVDRLQDYQQVIHYVLLDWSMGKGIGMSAGKMAPFIRAIREASPELGIVIAGGLGPNTMHLAEPLFQEFSGLSTDAAGRLRRSGIEIDPLDLTLTEGYISSSATRLCQ